MKGERLSSDEGRRFFGAKAWALLHDPPHKMWIIEGGVRAIGRGHEEEARGLWRFLGLDSVFGDPEEYDKLVSLADYMASTSDRWITNFVFQRMRRRVFRYNRLHNIFNPDLSLEVGPVTDFEVRKFFEDLAARILPYMECPRHTYHALYAVYEALWAMNGLGPCLADTRAPTHTLFDHAYATALTLNVLWPRGKVGGYAVLIDIPGIQQIVGAARKAGDFWAGSWMVSMLSWLTAWPLVWEYGADILLRPSPRLNPHYHAFLCEELNARNEYRGVFEALYAKIAADLGPRAGTGGIPLRFFIEYPIIPGTVVAILPKEGPRGSLLDANSVEETVKEKFGRACELLLKLVLGELEGLEEPYDAFARLIRIRGRGARLIELFRAIRERGAKAFEGLLKPRIVVIDVSKHYNEWLEALRSKAPLEGEPPLLSALREVRRELIDRGFTEEEVDEKLAWQALIALLFEELSREAKRKIVPPKAWFVLKDSTLEPIVDFEEFYDRRGVGYLLCTTCGNEPAIIKLGKDVKRPGVLEYSDDALSKLKELGFSESEVEELKLSVKPGEAIGPLCLFKRALYASLRSLEEPFEVFDSTEDVSISFVRSKLLGLTEYLRELGSVGERVKRYIEEEVRSFDSMLDQSAEKARSMYEQALDSALRQLMPRGKVQELLASLSSELGRFYAVEDLHVPEDLLTTFRNYYCILRADADNVGDLGRGKIEADKYVKLLESLQNVAKEAAERDAVEAFKEAIDITWSLLDKLGSILPSATYALTLSTALMVTALKDSINVEFRLYGTPIFSGGDDDLALLPIETGLAAVELLRSTYHGEMGFHRVGNYAIPAPVVYGKSFSLRFANILDLMADEVAECARLLDDVAKRARWTVSGKEFSKDTLAISSSRGGLSILPLADEAGGPSPACIKSSPLKALELMWLAKLCLQLSTGLPEDYDLLKEAVEVAVEKGDWDLAHKVLLRVLSRNVPRGKLEGEVLSRLVSELEEIKQRKQRGKVPLPGELEALELSAFSWLVEAYRVVRGYP